MAAGQTPAVTPITETAPLDANFTRSWRIVTVRLPPGRSVPWAGRPERGKAFRIADLKMGTVMSSVNAYAELNINEHEWIDRACAEISELFSSRELDKAAAMSILGLLKATMLLHYAEEERIMREVRYPNSSSHKRSHDFFVKEVSEFISALSNDAFGASESVWSGIKRKLDHHVEVHDGVLLGYLAGRREADAD